MSLVEQLDTVTDASAGTVDRHATTQTFESTNPASGAVVGVFPVHDTDAVVETVERARTAARAWVELGYDGRKQRLDAYRGYLARRMHELADLVHRENGKPHADAILEITLAIDHLAWAGAHARKTLGPRRVSAGMLAANHAAYLEYQPLGVIGVIGPWNYPVFTPMGSIGYALAAGNAVVFKPSEYTPAVGAWLAAAWRAAGPDVEDAFQVVTGFGETGAALCRAGVDKLAFTGSAATAKKVMATCAETLTPVVLECGGKDALLVDADADLDAAADAAVWGGMTNAGQACVGVARAYVVDSVAAEFTDRVVAQARRVKAGADPTSDIGPITKPDQLDVIRDHITDALARGGTALVGGPESVRPPYVEPIVLIDVPDDSIAVTEETFGPTLTVHRVANLDDAVDRVNAGRYGLGAAVFSAHRGAEIAARLRCGMVAINSALSFAAVPSLPFGGGGGSGFGRIHGADGLREFPRAKAVTRRLFRPTVPVLTFARPVWAIRVLLWIVRVRYGR